MKQATIMPMRKTMAEAKKTAAMLNSETDELNQVVGGFEQELQEAGVGVTVWLPRLLDESVTEERFDARDRDEKHPISFTRGWQIGFAKVKSDWRVAARYVREESADGDEWQTIEERPPIALVDAPRIVRVEAAPNLEALAQALIKRMSEYIEGIAQAKARAKE